MKTLEQIKNEYAISKGYDDIIHLIIDDIYDHNSAINIDKTITDLLILVQQEQQKIIAENACMKKHCGHSHTDEQISYYAIGADNIQIDKSSIINENNIIR